MRPIAFMAGVAAGMAVAGAAVTAMYPDVSRRVCRDARRLARCSRRKMGDMFC